MSRKGKMSNEMLGNFPFLMVEYWDAEGQRGFSVPYSLYNQAQVGDSIELQLGNGLLGIEWIVFTQLSESNRVPLFPSVLVSHCTLGLVL